jgi:PIN domain nuclease of toxin-antitoxin system
VTGYLLDTNIVLIALAQPELLPARLRKAILSGPHHLSAVSYWEVILKVRKGALDVGDPNVWWRRALEELAATPLSLRPEHVATICNLPPIHKDPFDRVLIAQAIVENLVLVTTDAQIPLYASSQFRVLKS